MLNSQRGLRPRLLAAVVTVALSDPKCGVCGQRVDIRMLQPFPGAPDIQACPVCINKYGEARPHVVH